MDLICDGPSRPFRCSSARVPLCPPKISATFDKRTVALPPSTPTPHTLAPRSGVLREARSEAGAPCLGFSLCLTELRALSASTRIFRGSWGQNAKQKAARGEMNGKILGLCFLSLPPPLPARGLCSQQGCRAGLRSREKPSAPQLPLMPTGPTLPRRHPRQILSALRACLFLPGGDPVPTYRPRDLSQPRKPLAPILPTK